MEGQPITAHDIATLIHEFAKRNKRNPSKIKIGPVTESLLLEESRTLLTLPPFSKELRFKGIPIEVDKDLPATVCTLED